MLEGPVRSGLARTTLAITVGLVLLSACDRILPTGPDDPPPAEPPPTALAETECSVDLRSAVLACGPPATMAADGGSVIVGRQGEDIAFASSDALVDGNIFSVAVTVQNLIGQAIGTWDGVAVADDGIRVFFSTEPWTVVGSGQVTVANADGADIFLEAQQLYHRYDEVLQPQVVSDAKRWEFEFDDVEVFRFRVMVSAPVQFPNGWIEVTPADEVLNPDATLQLAADVFDVFGDPVAAALTWSSTDAAVATVTVDGLVSGHARGTVTIEAESADGAPGSASIEVVPEIHSLLDTFAGTVVDTDLWADSIVGDAQVVQNGRLELVLAQDAHSSAIVRSVDYFDFRGSSTFVEISQFADGEGDNALVETTFLVGTRDLGQYVAISAVRWSAAGLELTAWEQWEDDAFIQIGSSLALNTAAHRFQRLREGEGTVYFEASEDGESWSVLWQVQHVFDDPARLHLWIAAAAAAEFGNPPPTSTEPAHVEGVGTVSQVSGSADAAVVAYRWVDHPGAPSGSRAGAAAE